MTRIVGGSWSGRRLVTPDGTTTRPTSERVRAAVANSLQAGGGLAGAAVLDLFAGTGALGLELLSRGAESLVAVEQDRAALAALKANVAALAPAQARVVAGTVAGFAAAPADGVRFDIVVADPPYDLPAEELAAALAALHAAGRLAPGADLVVERSVRAGDFPWPEPLVPGRSKRHGDTVLDRGSAP